MRIVTLLPSATEIVAALGLEHAIVGRSHECDHPAGVAALPVCTEPKLDPRGGSREIHNRVDAIVREGLSVYRVHVDVLNRLAPDWVITQDQCDVCAVSLADVQAAVCAVTSSQPRVLSLSPMTLADVAGDIRRVGEALGRSNEAEAVVSDMQRRFHAVRARTTGRPAPRTALIEWLDPLMGDGCWMPELVEIAGGVDVIGTNGRHSAWLEPAALAALDPDVVIAAPCGFDLDKTAREFALVRDRAPWTELRAVREGRVFVVDGNSYFNRPGPRLADSAEILAEILHPDLFPPRREGVDYRRVQPAAAGANVLTPAGR